MDASPQETIKQREIAFCPHHLDPDQAGSVSGLLQGVEGIHWVRRVDPLRLLVRYDIRSITLKMIEEALAALGFHLDNSLLAKLKRALFYYTEETQRANLEIACCQKDSTTQVFVCRYQRRRHGCRDDRPDHWRKYL